MKHRASFFLIVIGIVALLLFRRSVKEGFVTCTLSQYIITSAAGKQSCASCPGGNSCDGYSKNICPVGSFCVNAKVNPCPLNTYTNLTGQSVCTACPAGKITNITGRTSVAFCECPDGTYINGTSCSQLPVGYTKGVNGEKIICPTGSYCAGGSANGTCSVGQYQDKTGQSSCKACTLGSYCPQNSSAQNSCPANSFCVNSSTKALCPSGLTSPSGSTSSTACVCPSNKYGTTCTACPANATCDGGLNFTCPSQYTKTATACICAIGYGASCTACPTNATCTGGATFTCKAGYSNTGTACTECPSGYACPGSGSTNTKCTNNTYSAGSAATCTSCGAGFYSLAGASQCTACAPNTVSCSSDTSFSCQTNYFSNAGACTACPSNSTCAPGGTATQTGLTGIVCNSSYSLTDNGSRCVKNQFSSNLPNHTQGTIQQMNDSMPYTNTIGCDRSNTCQYNWSNVGSNIIGPASSNPCPAKNSWYDWGQQRCVDSLGKSVDIMNPCGSNTVYTLKTNECLQVRVPFTKQPPNTIGMPSLTTPGDFSNCKTTDNGDCTPYFKNSNGTFITNNPCTPPSQYNFLTQSCTMTSNARKASNCCGLAASNLTTPACSNLVSVKSVSTKNTAMCSNTKPNICCGATMANNATCIKNGYWIKATKVDYNPSYKTLCGVAGFDDYTNNLDTMAAVSY